MPLPCLNYTFSNVCQNLLHFCDINYISLQDWCRCLIKNYDDFCGFPYYHYFQSLLLFFVFCLLTVLCITLCGGIKKARPRQLAPPPYVIVRSDISPPIYEKISEQTPV